MDSLFKAVYLSLEGSGESPSMHGLVSITEVVEGFHHLILFILKIV